MPVSSTDLNGTPGAHISTKNMSGGYGTFVVGSFPDQSTTEAYLETVARSNPTSTTSLRVTNIATAAVWLCSSPSVSTYYRAYYFFSAAPVVNTTMMIHMGSSYARSSQIGITTDRRLFATAGQIGVNSTHVSAGAGAATGTTAANSIPLNTWIRVEALIQHTGTYSWSTAKVWTTNPESTGAPDLTLDPGVSTNLITLGANNDTGDSRMGLQAFADGWVTMFSSGSYARIDDVAMGTDDWIGPSYTAVSARRGHGIVRY